MESYGKILPVKLEEEESSQAFHELDILKSASAWLTQNGCYLASNCQRSLRSDFCAPTNSSLFLKMNGLVEYILGY